MTKIEELRAAYEATTGGEWDWGQHLSVTNISFSEVRTADGEDILFHSAQPALVENSDNAQFTALAHNLMPTLLEAVEALEKMGTSFEDLLNGYPERELHEPYQMTLNRAAEVLEKLK